jgi:hypothetical protein
MARLTDFGPREIGVVVQVAGRTWAATKTSAWGDQERAARYPPARRSNRLRSLVNTILNWTESLGARSQRHAKWYCDIFTAGW